jgi:phosphoglycolate phosphatase-like HAD superfamily hydrolase
MLIALDIDGTLIDTSASFTRIVRELSGADHEEVRRFRERGGFNDDWELARALTAWIRAGRPDVVHEVFDWRDVIARVGHDPGDLSAECTRRYRGGYWRDERVLVERALLEELGARHRVVACTGRDRWELERAQETLGFTFSDATVMEDVKKPDPRALLRLVRDSDDAVVLVGDTEADRLCAESARPHLAPRALTFVQVSPSLSAADYLRSLLAP